MANGGLAPAKKRMRKNIRRRSERRKSLQLMHAGKRPFGALPDASSE